MRRDHFVWLIVIYILLFIVGYWPEWAKNQGTFPKPRLYSIPVTVQMAPPGDS